MFDQMKKAAEFAALAEHLSTMDVGGGPKGMPNGIPDAKDYLVLGGRLSEALKDVHQVTGEIEALFGADVEAIKKRFNV